MKIESRFYLRMLLVTALLTTCEKWDDFERINFGETETGEAFDITRRTAKLSGVIKGLLNEDDRVEQFGFVWSTDSLSLLMALGSEESLIAWPDSLKSIIGATSVNGRFETEIQGLEYDTEYFFAGFGIIESEVFYDAIGHFTTLEFIDLFFEGDPKFVDRDKAEMISSVKGLLPGDEVVEIGHVWDTTPVVPAIGRSPQSAFTGLTNDGSFATMLDSLVVGREYQLRTFLVVRTSEKPEVPDTIYTTDTRRFTFIPDPIKVITGNDIDQRFEPKSIVISGSRVDGLLDLEIPPDSVGIEMTRISDSTNQRFYAEKLASDFSFEVKLPDLGHFTEYSYRAFAKIGQTLIWGDPESFSTTTDVQVNPSAIELVAKDVANAASTILNIDPENVAAIGHCWSSTNLFPTIESGEHDGITAITDFGAVNQKTFVSLLENLELSSEYRVRTYALFKNGQVKYQESTNKFNTIELELVLNTDRSDDGTSITTDVKIYVGSRSDVVNSFPVVFSEIALSWSPVDDTLAKPEDSPIVVATDLELEIPQKENGQSDRRMLFQEEFDLSVIDSIGPYRVEVTGLCGEELLTARRRVN